MSFDVKANIAADPYSKQEHVTHRRDHEIEMSPAQMLDVLREHFPEADIPSTARLHYYNYNFRRPYFKISWSESLK